MEADTSVKALAVLTAIPVVILALWADYFGRAIDQLTQENPHFDRTTEHYKVRLAGIGALFLQFGIFVGSSPLRADAPLFGTASFVVAVIAQAVIQARVDVKVRGNAIDVKTLRPQTGSSQEAPRESEFEAAARAFFWATLGGAAYLLVLFASLLVFSGIARLVDATQIETTLLVIIGSILGVAGGIGLNFALGAFHLRKILPVKAIEDQELKTMLSACFTQAGIAVPGLWLVQSERVREATAMIAGFSGGRGIFKPGLFLSRRMVDEMTRDELRAVVLHEVSHLKLGHLRKRLAFSIALIVGSTAAATFCVFLAGVIAAEGEFKNIVGLAAAAGAFLSTFNLLGRQSRLHEIEADIHAVAVLNAGHEDLISALRKIDRVNRQNLLAFPSANGPKNLTHPSTEMRIALLNARFGKPSTGATEERDQSAA